MPAQLPEAARERLAARARRVTLIRRSVVAAVLVAFVLAWAVIAYTGPMGSQSAVASTSATAATSSSSSSSGSSSSSTWSDGGNDQGAVTTAQS